MQMEELSEEPPWCPASAVPAPGPSHFLSLPSWGRGAGVVKGDPRHVVLRKLVLVCRQCSLALTSE